MECPKFRKQPEEHIGLTGLHEVDYRHGTAVTGTIIGRRSLHGRGLGTEAVALRTHHAFNVLGLRLLMSQAFADNTASLRLLEKAGYRECGRIPQRFWKRGAYRDLILLSLHRDDWKP